jgi:hypothetical protein
MTFDKANWGETDVGFAYTVSRNFKYQSTDTLATIIASGYFNDVVGDVKKYSFIAVVASDDVNLYYVNSATGATPVTVLPLIDSSVIPDGAVTNVKVNAAAAIEWSKMAAVTDGSFLVGNGSNEATVVAMSGDATLANTGALTIAANAVELGMLAAGITPSHVARFAGKHAYGGGGTSDAATIAGVVAGDIVIATIEAATNACYLAKAVPTTDTVTFHFSADPGASTVVSYTVFNAAS